MSKVIMLKGLPASGKSTYAKELLSKDPMFKRVNRDSLRDMIDGGKWSENREKLIRRSQLALAELFTSQNFNIVVDDTNFSESAQNMWRQFAEQHKAKLETKFFDTPVEECIKRDLARPNSVGQDVIMRMYNDFLKPPVMPYTPAPSTPKAIMVDIDGTLAHMNGRSPYDPTLYHTDTVDPVVADLVRSYHSLGYKILICSGRDDTHKDVTVKWLNDNDVPFDDIFMRPMALEADPHKKLKDWVVKARLFNDHIRDCFDVHFVLDDRTQVVKEWRRLGLKVLQVDEGEF